MKNPYNNQGGFTLLELIAVIAIIGVLTFYALPAIQEWIAKRSFEESLNDIYSELSQARMQAFEKDTTTRITTTATGDTYTFTTDYYSAGTVAICDTSASGWTNYTTKTLELNTNFTISGTAVAIECFYRDGTSSGGTYDLTQKNGLTNLGSGHISVTLATGYVDVTKD